MGENRLLARLPVWDQSRIGRKLVARRLEMGTVLFEPGAIVDEVNFPLDGVFSLETCLESGESVEVATIGNEGVVGVPAMVGGSLAVRAVSQVAGRSLSLSMSDFMEELAASQAMARLVQNYIQVLFGQIALAVACNRLHSSEERLSRWILLSQDRIGKDEIAITQGGLGPMLGTRQSVVALATDALVGAGMIRYWPSHIEVIDRSRLEVAACECYRVLRAELDAVSGTSPPSPP